MNEDDERIERRIRAAHKCLSLFYPTENGSSLHVPESQKDADDGVQRGKICEDSCVAFLIEHCPNTILRKRIVMSNIFVNARRDGQHRSQKYVFPKTPRTNSPPKPNSSGIVSTNYTGYGLCSEFDAIVVSSEILDSADGRCDGSTKAIIESVWEAKKTVSPARCTTCCRRNWPPSRPCWTTRMPNFFPNWCTATTTTMAPAIVEGPSFTLGIYWSELQRPEDAADGIRTIALSHVVSSDVREVVRALDRECDLDEGYISVGVDLDIALRIVRGLKSLVEEIERRQVVRVVLVLEEDVDFP